MSQEQWTAVDRYITDLLVPPDPALDHALQASAAAGLPAISVSANQGKFLMLLAQLCGAARILEVGTLGAYSTIWLARGLRPGGRLLTLESNPLHARVARENLSRAELDDVVELRIGAALEALPQIEAAREEPFDLVFIDADKENTPEYFRWALRLTRPGSLIVVDNVIRDGAVVDPASTDSRVQGMRRFARELAAETRVNATAIQTVGSKGYDGFAIARVVASA